MSCSRDLVKSRNNPTTAGKGRIASCNKHFVLPTKRVSLVRIRMRMQMPNVNNTAGCFALNRATDQVLRKSESSMIMRRRNRIASTGWLEIPGSLESRFD